MKIKLNPQYILDLSFGGIFAPIKYDANEFLFSPEGLSGKNFYYVEPS